MLGKVSSFLGYKVRREGRGGGGVNDESIPDKRFRHFPFIKLNFIYM